MIAIDGSKGEGGGQILRSSVALSAVTGRPCRIDNIRAGRKKPGLMRQHLTAVKAAAEVCQAQLAGASIGSSRLDFSPGRITGGDYQFSVGTAGSATLVLQTVLPALLIAERPSDLVLEGGTHNPLAPPFDFLVRSYLPLLKRMGLSVTAELVRPGFYPAGGGCVRVHVEPAGEFKSLELLERGDIVRRQVRAMIAHLPKHVGQRECQALRERAGWDLEVFSVEELRESRGPGNALVVELESQHITEVFTGFGEARLPAEMVAHATWDEVRRYLAAGVPVAEHLADQLLLPLALGVHRGGSGGSFRTLALSQHSTTHIDIIKTFLEVDVSVDRRAHDDVSVLVR